MGILYIVATPIGNLEDITLRASKTLAQADLILCEDTRHTGMLLQKLQITTKMLPYYDQVEDKRIPEVLEMLSGGYDIALVSDAGTPLISDPGFRLVRECIKRGIAVVSIPGPSALLAALTSSGLPADKFTFLGFITSKNIKLVQPGITTIFYAAPHKIHQNLRDLKSHLGDVEIVIARELTKMHEELWHGKISDAVTYFENPQGEFVLLLNIPQE